jgi:hypothetical protein
MMAKSETERMVRVDLRLPKELVARLEDYAFALGLSTSEVLRWMVISELRRTGRVW